MSLGWQMLKVFNFALYICKPLLNYGKVMMVTKSNLNTLIISIYIAIRTQDAVNEQALRYNSRRFHNIPGNKHGGGAQGGREGRVGVSFS